MHLTATYMLIPLVQLSLAVLPPVIAGAVLDDACRNRGRGSGGLVPDP